MSFVAGSLTAKLQYDRGINKVWTAINLVNFKNKSSWDSMNIIVYIYIFLNG